LGRSHEVGLIAPSTAALLHPFRGIGGRFLSKALPASLSAQPSEPTIMAEIDRRRTRDRRYFGFPDDLLWDLLHGR
jgi:hypothetical protein